MVRDEKIDLKLYIEFIFLWVANIIFDIINTKPLNSKNNFQEYSIIYIVRSLKEDNVNILNNIIIKDI